MTKQIAPEYQSPHHVHANRMIAGREKKGIQGNISSCFELSQPDYLEQINKAVQLTPPRALRTGLSVIVD